MLLKLDDRRSKPDVKFSPRILRWSFRVSYYKIRGHFFQILNWPEATFLEGQWPTTKCLNSDHSSDDCQTTPALYFISIFYWISLTSFYYRLPFAPIDIHGVSIGQYPMSSRRASTSSFIKTLNVSIFMIKSQSDIKFDIFFGIQHYNTTTVCSSKMKEKFLIRFCQNIFFLADWNFPVKMDISKTLVNKKTFAVYYDQHKVPFSKSKWTKR